MDNGGQRGNDIQWHMTLSADDALRGCVQTVAGESIQVPAGTQHGSLLKFTGRGEPGFGDGPRGDLVIEVHVEGFQAAAVHAGATARPGSRTNNGCLLAGALGCGCLVLMIPVLAAILFPVFAKAREKARSASCQSNARIIAIAMAQYSQDWDECLAPHQNQGGSWPDLISPYLASPRSLTCPAADGLTPSYVYRAVPPRAVPMKLLKEPQTQLMGIDGSREGIAWRHVEHANAWFLDGHVKLVGRDTAGSQYAGLDRLGPYVTGKPQPGGPAGP